jgi:hypothetical protein
MVRHDHPCEGLSIPEPAGTSPRLNRFSAPRSGPHDFRDRGPPDELGKRLMNQFTASLPAAALAFGPVRDQPG